MGEYALYRSWFDHGDVFYGTYTETKQKYEESLRTSGRIPAMRIECEGVVIRRIDGEWVSPNEWQYRQKEPQ